MAYRLSTRARNLGCDAIGDDLNSGKVRFRTGAQPTNVSDADSGTLLATCTLNATAFGASSTGVKTANSVTSDTNAAASGTCAHARIYRSDNSTIHSDADAAQGSGSFNFDNNVIVAGGTVAISSLTLTQPIS
jgi:hypothetical protein